VTLSATAEASALKPSLWKREESGGIVKPWLLRIEWFAPAKQMEQGRSLAYTGRGLLIATMKP
jgi:hypothetical protein